MLVGPVKPMVFVTVDCAVPCASPRNPAAELETAIGSVEVMVPDVVTPSSMWEFPRAELEDHAGI